MKTSFLFFFYRFTNLAVILVLVFISSCRPAKELKHADKISQDERAWLTQFFSDIMFFQHGIYTLWGAHKPMIIFPVADYSDEEMQTMFDSYSEEDKKKKGFKVDVIEGYNFPEAWKKWEKISHLFPMKRYMLFKQVDEQDPQVFFVVFIDILKTAAVIQDNYEAFQKAMGFDFHPLEFTLQMNQKDSAFWENINPYLYGLLFGFGKMNSQLFYWKQFDHPKSCTELCQRIKPSFSNEQLIGNIKFTIDNFQIPSFMSFNEMDSVINIYREERMLIKEIYKDKDFLDLTLQQLTN